MKSRPAAERLEPRRLLACIVFTNGDVLNIVGDNTANNINVAVRTNDLTPGANVTCDGVNTPVATPIHTVTILSNGGDDQINVQFGSTTFRPFLDPTLTFQMATGDGNDTAAVTVYGSSANGGSVLMAMGGGLGNDNLSGTVDVAPPPPVIIDPGVNPATPVNDRLHINMTIGGAKGDDTLAANIHQVLGRSPVILSDDEIVLAGGEGNDQLSASVTGQHATDSIVFIGATGDAGDDRISALVALAEPEGIAFDGIAVTPNTEVNLLGGDGNDRIDFAFGTDTFRPEFNPATHITLDGGAGIDVITSNTHAASSSGLAAAYSAAYTVTGGLGNDIIRVTFDIAPNLQPEISAGGSPIIVQVPLTLDVNIDGGNAADLIDVSVTQTNALGVFPDDSFNVTGGQGNDRINFAYAGDVPAMTTLDVTLDGGADNDSINANLNFSGRVPTPGSIHRTIRLLGGTGSDALTLLGVGLGLDPNDVDQIDGGPGIDACFTNVPGGADHEL